VEEQSHFIEDGRVAGFSKSRSRHENIVSVFSGIRHVGTESPIGFAHEAPGAIALYGRPDLPAGNEPDASSQVGCCQHDQDHVRARMSLAAIVNAAKSPATRESLGTRETFSALRHSPTPLVGNRQSLPSLRTTTS